MAIWVIEKEEKSHKQTDSKIREDKKANTEKRRIIDLKRKQRRKRRETRKERHKTERKRKRERHGIHSAPMVSNFRHVTFINNIRTPTVLFLPIAHTSKRNFPIGSTTIRTSDK